MVVLLDAHNGNIETFADEALYHAIELCDEGTDEIVEQIDPSRGEVLLDIFAEPVEAEDEPVPLAQHRKIARHRNLAGSAASYAARDGLSRRPRADTVAGVGCRTDRGSECD